jgi:hypothetical protein
MYRKYIFIIKAFKKNYSSRDTFLLTVPVQDKLTNNKQTKMGEIMKENVDPGFPFMRNIFYLPMLGTRESVFIYFFGSRTSSNVFNGKSSKLSCNSFVTLVVSTQRSSTESGH